MKISILGATGATGKLLVEKALAKGYSVTAFVRNPSKLAIENENLEIVKGDISDRQSIKNAITRQDAVLSALGTSNPMKRSEIFTQGVRNVVEVMEEEGVKRFIYLSSFGVGDSYEQLPFLLKVLLWGILLRGIFADHEESEKFIKASKLDWTIVCPGNLTNKGSTGNFRHGEAIESNTLKPTISRADTADFMLQQLETDEYLKKSPTIIY